MSGPLSREDRRDKGLQEAPDNLTLPDVEWDREEELEVGSRQQYRRTAPIILFLKEQAVKNKSHCE